MGMRSCWVAIAYHSIINIKATNVFILHDVTYWSWIRLLTGVTELRYECYGLDSDNAMWWVGGLEKRYYCLKLEPLECVPRLDKIFFQWKKNQGLLPVVGWSLVSRNLQGKYLHCYWVNIWNFFSDKRFSKIMVHFDCSLNPSVHSVDFRQGILSARVLHGPLSPS